MSHRIHVLPAHTANQIAAGEVVERPAAVVKELLENAIDAGATHIEIEINHGGINLIRVRDNGSGIEKDDLPLAISRHATSKIRELNDLNRLQSLGFRGEALASISSVARMKIISCVEKDAWQLNISGANTASITPASHPQGTTIEASDLFFNAPVRRKFLRTEKTEFGHIEDVVKRAALSQADIALSLTHNGRTLFSVLSAQSYAEQCKRVAKLCGQQFIHQSIAIDWEAEGLQLRGWISPPNASRAYSDLQYFFLNGRMVKDKLLNHAVRAAAQRQIPPGRYLAYVLYLSCDPATIDINVHPTKHEVRFHDNRLIHDFIHRGLEKHLTNIPETVDTPPEPLTTTTPSIDYLQSLPLAQLEIKACESPAKYTANLPTDYNAEFGRVIAYVQQQFIIAEQEQGLIIVDRKKAQQLIYQQQFQHAIDDADQLVSQPLLIPETIQLPAKHIKLLLEQQALLQRCGIHMQQVLNTRFMLRQLPDILKQANLSELLAILCQNPLQRWATLLAQTAASSATFDQQQAQQILNDLTKLLDQSVSIDSVYRKILWHDL